MKEFDPTLFPIENIEDVKNFFVYRYHFIDNSSFITPAVSFLKKNDYLDADKYINAVKQLFLANGWEGDGEIGVIWIPPFIGIDEDTYGFALWHVKQLNNGTSWLASPKKLPFKSLEAQNNKDSILSGFTKPESIIQEDIDSFLSRLKTEKENFISQVEMLQKMEHGKPTRNEILTTLFGFTQNQLISMLNDLMDGCYLRFLLEGINHGNKAIKLKKLNISANLASYFPDDSEDISEDGIQWLTLQQVISDIWKAYKFLRFKDKFEYLIKAVEYTPDKANRDMIFKHVVIRNCIQHYDWQLEKSSLAQIGVNQIDIATTSKPIIIKVWKKISLTSEEVLSLFEILNNFSNDFGKHVDKFVKTRVYARESK